MSLGAWLRILGGNGVDPASSSNPLPVSTADGVGSLAADSILSVTSTAGAAATLTIPAVPDKRIVVSSVVIELYSTTARTANAVPPKVNSTGLSNVLGKLLPFSATAIGTLETFEVIPAPVKASTVGTAVTFTSPVIAGCIMRTVATYSYV